MQLSGPPGRMCRHEEVHAEAALGACATGRRRKRWLKLNANSSRVRFADAT